MTKYTDGIAYQLIIKIIEEKGKIK